MGGSPRQFWKSSTPSSAEMSRIVLGESLLGCLSSFPELKRLQLEIKCIGLDEWTDGGLEQCRNLKSLIVNPCAYFEKASRKSCVHKELAPIATYTGPETQ
ncbi:hypothetical protein CUMW_265450 [Citrus unshiu]|uniref:Uncharacterized protein n=1 Tax=Citrus unshiu TaxID=55188 RepID=A0A2H5QVE9_CITUN|nr:hypothetical protein CUMW_265450 [Citrus unshiu]